MKKLTVLFALLYVFCAAHLPSQDYAPQHTWATSVKIAGVPNLRRVMSRPGPIVLWCSGQPTKEGFKNLHNELGITTIINLRARHSDAAMLPDSVVEIRIPCHVWHPEKEDAYAVLWAVKSAPGPIDMHCERGSDRAGWAKAICRRVFQYWTAKEAINEMKYGGFGLCGLWLHFGDLDGFIERFDADEAREVIGWK